MIPDSSAWRADEVPAETNATGRNTHIARPRGTTDFVRRPAPPRLSRRR